MQGRIKFFNMLLRQVERCGIPMKWGQRVVDFYEIEVAGVGGIVLDSGERKEADVVIAAGRCGERCKKRLLVYPTVLTMRSCRWYQVAVW